MLSSLAPSAASASTRAALYPVQAKGRSVPAPSLQATQEFLAGALRMAKGRRVFAARTPLVLDATCPVPVQTGCLAALADGGVVFYAEARPVRAGIRVELAWVASDGRRTEAVPFTFNPHFQDLRVALLAIESLEPQKQAVRSARAVTSSPDRAVAAREHGGLGPRAHADPLSVDAPALWPAGERAAEPSPGAWLQPTGIGCVLGGLALAGGGATFGFLSRGIGDDLTRRYQAGALLPEDRASYDRVRAFNLLANTLMIGGGLVTATGATFWMMAGAGDGTSVGIGGRF